MNEDEARTVRSTSTLGARLAALWEHALFPEPGAKGKSEDIKAEFPVPVVWMLGKVQAGKSSIVRALTGSSLAEIGSGFRPCTTASRIYDCPEDEPAIRFLDTRGIGEVNYDPGEDIAYSERHAHLLLVVMRAMDHAQDDIIRVVTKVRRRRPKWPIVVAQTALHDGYGAGMDHVMPYPFNVEPGGVMLSASSLALPADLIRSLVYQRTLFQSLEGDGTIAFVPLDFTDDSDDFRPRNYGLEALVGTLRSAAPEALSVALEAMHGSNFDAVAMRAHSHIVGHAVAAGAVDVVPLAGAVAVPGVQAKLLHSIGRIYGVEWDRQMLIQFGGCLGSSIVTRILASFGIRQAAKLLPGYGQTIGAAAAAVTSFTTTYALGKAACYFVSRRKAGQTINAADIAATYAQSLDDALRLAKEQGIGANHKRA